MRFELAGKETSCQTCRLRGRLRRRLRFTGARVVQQLSDFEVLAQVNRLVAVADVVETLGRILARQLQQHLFATGMLLKELGDIIDRAVYHDPQILGVIVTGDFVDRVDVRHGTTEGEMIL